MNFTRAACCANCAKTGGSCADQSFKPPSRALALNGLSFSPGVPWTANRAFGDPLTDILSNIAGNLLKPNTGGQQVCPPPPKQDWTPAYLGGALAFVVGLGFGALLLGGKR